MPRSELVTCFSLLPTNLSLEFFTDIQLHFKTGVFYLSDVDTGAPSRSFKRQGPSRTAKCVSCGTPICGSRTCPSRDENNTYIPWATDADEEWTADFTYGNDCTVRIMGETEGEAGSQSEDHTQA